MVWVAFLRFTLWLYQITNGKYRNLFSSPPL